MLLLHGLTATRRYVVHGSRALERAGHRVVQYDARGHGESSGAPDPGAYTYAHLAADAVAVLDALGIERAALVGQSMGAATAVAVALGHPGRVAALGIVTPAHLGRPSDDLDAWDRRAAGLERGGPEGFLEALGPLSVGERWRDTVRTVILQRLGRHADPHALADALRATPRSAAFDGMESLERIAAPTLVVGSRDEVDPDHPLAVAEEYARRIPGARLVVEAPGESPLAWRGGALSKELLPLLAGAGYDPGTPPPAAAR
ncbi:alpha/beta fold hydrolase [Miltoncostaea marina]|uniref:alpha/beta fold hydrolase n=1 Tax=Miltoncostaea marina TaxID=2843215 RepID=UPI001C3DB137|nr:alpha/beta fold hydrolase [Miltoncostaea marina]